MEYNSKNFFEQENNKLSSGDKKAKKLSECPSEINTDQADKLNFDKETLNLFKGIVKIKDLSSKKQNKAPIIKSNSVNNNKNIFEFANFLYNNEEHLHKNEILTVKHSENNPSQNDILSPIKSFTHKFSTNGKFGFSKMVMNFSKEKNNASDMKKSLFKKNSHNFSSFSPKKKSHKNLLIKTKFGDSGHSIHKSNKNFSFFFKLKEKEKIPSKTPYLDSKFWKSSYDVTKFVTNDTNSKSPKKKISSKMSLFNCSQTPKNLLKNHLNENDNIEDKNNNCIKYSDKKLFLNNVNNIDNIDKKIEKTETKKTENNNKIIENKNCLQNKKKGICANNIIINILNKPFLCCLKS